MSTYSEIRAIAARFDLDLNMVEGSREGILADWKEMTCGSDLHQEIEGALTQAGIEHDWVDGMRKTIIEVRARSVPLAHAAGGIDITWRHLPAPHYADFE